MQIKEIIQAIEAFAPPCYQESYDNSGVQVGATDIACEGALLTLDITEKVILEAKTKGCNLVIAHHPLIFSGIKKISGNNAIERCIILAIQNNITLYAAHTNLDNMRKGVNDKIATKLGLQHRSILSPKTDSLYKLYTYVPETHIEQVRQALFDCGAGAIGNYEHCSFNTPGTGTFKGNEQARPFIGQAGGNMERVAEIRLEMIVPEHLKGTILSTLKASHPYEEVAYELVSLVNSNQDLGAGMIGSFEQARPVAEVLALIRAQLKAPVIRHTALVKDTIQTIALCGGSGSFLLKQAQAAKADLFLTADYKYHQFFEAEDKIIIADIGHYESEQFTVEIFNEIISKKFPNFAVYLSQTKTNPINYYF
ncbi:MAG: Nif3-like dinuclear metal center hexameric protein [Sphingobacteriales bacterium]|nr:MAG: Nif3-like dinuclear metal center hexameric protein [Sphingobacteriales bacterium]